jgi:hypothetical protein
VQQGGIEGGLSQAARDRQYPDCFVAHHWFLTRSPEVALAVLSKVAPLCADRCLFLAGGKSDNKLGNPEQASHRVYP